ncbi:hypothetical protein D5366_08940 [Neokomagataea tanensis]|uniref:General secretion pathway protein GspK n=1 Tax=Neokomagataea tanensis TaxID=661191 RepID=A0A4Y6V5D0_9PROT|nr:MULTISPECIES: hypothetical protein [Neokomagataea]QDH25312.1 hypothetical protein D5366_08940 [Neokomagataea tanensis]
MRFWWHIYQQIRVIKPKAHVPVKAGSNDAGFALLLVLWTLAFLALIGTHVLLQGRTMVVEASAYQQQAMLELTTDSAIRQELYTLILSSPHVPAGIGNWHERDDGLFRIMTRVQLERGQVNPSLVTQDLLAAVMQSSGIPTQDAERAAAALFNWRGHPLLGAAPPAINMGPADMGNKCSLTHGPFHSFDDMAALPGVGEAIIHKIAPSISLSAMQYPTAQGAVPAVQSALARLGRSNNQNVTTWSSQSPSLGGGVSVVVEAMAQNGNNTQRRRAHIVLMPDAEPEPWHVLRWETVPANAP